MVHNHICAGARGNDDGPRGRVENIQRVPCHCARLLSESGVKRGLPATGLAGREPHVQPLHRENVGHHYDQLRAKGVHHVGGQQLCLSGFQRRFAGIFWRP